HTSGIIRLVRASGFERRFQMSDRTTSKDVQRRLEEFAAVLGKDAVKMGERRPGALVLTTQGGNLYRSEECIDGAGLHRQPFGASSYKLKDICSLMWFAESVVELDRSRR